MHEAVLQLLSAFKRLSIKSICSLYNLQTLILSGCRNLEELPSGTRDLGSLRRLDISGCDSLKYMPRGLGELTCLQTLSDLQTFSDFVCVEEGGRRGNYAEVCELKSLVNLRGALAIRNLRASKCAKCERKRSCILVELKLITQLHLDWNLKDGEEEAELLLIESLKPHPNLECLIIRWYPGKKFPSWMDRMNIGVSLPNIVYINLYGWLRLPHVAALGLLPCLRQLHLWRMESMEYLIDRSSLEEEADQLLFPSLKKLYLGYMWGLKSLVEPTEASQTPAANNSRYFLVLEKLQIEKCHLFTSLGNEDGKLFVSLLELHLSHVRTETVPSWVQYLPNLQTLKLSTCWEIASLPEWMGNLTSLQQLRLEGLHSLASIPDSLQRLTSLQELRICDSPELECRCEKEAGVDWHKIAHIPNISFSKL